MTVPKVAGLNCPNCGASVAMRTFGQAVSVVCPSCNSILDAKDPNVSILQKAQSAQRIQPLIPLGSRGGFEGAKFEVIGFQVRTVNDPDDGPDSWSEYLLYNPIRGYRYLTEYKGHWNLVRVAQAIPELESDTQVRFAGASFRLHSAETAQTSYIIGEFPWVVHGGDTADVADYSAPPQILSRESTPEETVWSVGRYIDAGAVWQAFGLANAAPASQGVAANQPSPFPPGSSLWGTAWKLVIAAFVLALLFSAMAGHQVFRDSVVLASGPRVTPAFDVQGHESNLQIEAANQGEESFYVHYSLVDQASGQARSFARSVGKEDKAVVPSVKPGRYALRMEADPPGAQFELTIRRGATSLTFFWIAAVLLLLPPLAQTFKRASFERSRGQG